LDGKTYESDGDGWLHSCFMLHGFTNNRRKAVVGVVVVRSGEEWGDFRGLMLVVVKKIQPSPPEGGEGLENRLSAVFFVGRSLFFVACAGDNHSLWYGAGSPQLVLHGAMGTPWVVVWVVVRGVKRKEPAFRAGSLFCLARCYSKEGHLQCCD